MVPATSSPGTGFGSYAGPARRWLQSCRFTPAVATSMSTSSGAGTGTGTVPSRSTSGPPAAVMSTACCCDGMRVSVIANALDPRLDAVTVAVIRAR